MGYFTGLGSQRCTRSIPQSRPTSHKPVNMCLQTQDTARQFTKYTLGKTGYEPARGPTFYREASWHEAGIVIQQALQQLTGAQG